MKLAIYKLEDTTKPLCVLKEGAHTLGRGPLLDCTDKRISRNHVSIVIDNSTASFSLVHHTNPCYWKCVDSKHISLLKPNIPKSIQDGDMFGLFPDVFWFTLKYYTSNEDTMDNVTVLPSTSGLNVSDTVDNHNETNEIVTKQDGGLQNGNLLSVVNDGNSESANEVNIENGDASSLTTVTNEATTENINNVLINQENLDINLSNEENTAQNQNVSVNQPSCSSTTTTTGEKVIRDRCWYGTSCYRKNPIHRQEFSHEGDADYDTDPEDYRPACPYGRNCTRKNVLHRKQLKHSDQAALKLQAANANNKRPHNDLIDDDEDVDDCCDANGDDNGGINPNNILPNKKPRKTRKQNNDNNADNDEEEDPFATDEDDDYVEEDVSSDSDHQE